jgi:hypothetical protein
MDDNMGRMAFCDELAMVVNARMPSGDSVSMSNTEEFFGGSVEDCTSGKHKESENHGFTGKLEY